MTDREYIPGRGCLGYLFDTNALNELTDAKGLPDDKLDNVDIYVTQWQWDQLIKTRNPIRKEKLLSTFMKILPTQIEAGSSIWPVTEEDKDVLQNKIFNSLEKDKKNHKDNKNDSEIGVTAIINRKTLVTNDRALYKTLKELNKPVVSFQEFLDEIEDS